MKRIDFQRFSQKEKDNALNEVSILSNISHPNVIRFHEAFFYGDNNQYLW